MSKEFKCYKCKAYLGEMKKGKIKKDVGIYCRSCHNKVVANEIKPKNPLSDILDGLYK